MKNLNLSTVLLAKLTVLVFCLFFYNGSAWAGDCDTTIAEDVANSQLVCADNDELIVSENITYNRNGKTAISAGSRDNVTVTNHGTISSTSHFTLNFRSGTSPTVDNKSTGTISSSRCCTIEIKSTDGTVNITNAGTIESSTHGTIVNWGVNSAAINVTNTGTITMSGANVNQSRVDALCAICTTGSSGAVTIINSGTVQTSGNNNPAIYSDDLTETTITNSGTISGHGTAKDIKIGDNASGSATTTININRGATWNKGIDLGETNSKIVLGSDNNRDVTVTIYNHDNLNIVNNTGTNGYQLTTEDLDSGGSDNDGTLTIYGENLEYDPTNQEYRGENTLTKLRGLFNAVNYVGGQLPDYCTTVDSQKVASGLDEVCNQRFVKLFHSYQTRDGVYDGTSSGVVGVLSPIKWKGFPLVSNIFVGYANQEGDFNNGEYLGGDNFALGFKNTYENKGFKASLTPMIGVNDFVVIDYDTDKVQTVTNDFLSEFAAINGKIKKKIATGEDRSLNVSVETTYGLQRFPDYISKFTDGDLSVDESIEKLLSGGFEVSYVEGLPGDFIIKPYFGANKNKNLSNQTKITARGENKNISPAKETWSGYYAGVSLTKEAKGIDFDLNLMYGNEDGLINQIAAVSLTKSFGTSKKETIKLEPVPDLPKADESLTTQDYTKDLNKLEAQNEKLKLLAEKVLQENETSKHLIKELVTEVEKLKLTNKIFKDKILKLENEKAELPQTIEEEDQKPKIDKFKLLLFLATIYGLAGGLTLLIIPFMNMIKLKLANHI